MTLTAKQVSVVRDGSNDDRDSVIEYIRSPIGISDPIDFSAFKSAVQELGPFRMRSEENPYSVEITVVRCSCTSPDCDGDVVLVRRRNGVFSIQWMMSPEELCEFDSLEHLRDNVLAGYMIDTCAERQAMEQEIERTLGQHYLDVQPRVCFCSACAAAIGVDQLPLNMLLGQMAGNLRARLEHIEDAIEACGEEVEEYIETAFDLGYNLGRQYSEYQVKRDIEGDALAGRSFESFKARRAQGAGLASSGNRLKRITALLRQMEVLIAGSPALTRIGPEALAKIACEDAAAEDPALWSQGAGQVLEYLGEIRRGEAGPDLKDRYYAMFPQARGSHGRH